MKRQQSQTQSQNGQNGQNNQIQSQTQNQPGGQQIQSQTQGSDLGIDSKPLNSQPLNSQPLNPPQDQTRNPQGNEYVQPGGQNPNQSGGQNQNQPEPQYPPQTGQYPAQPAYQPGFQQYPFGVGAFGPQIMFPQPGFGFGFPAAANPGFPSQTLDNRFGEGNTVQPGFVPGFGGKHFKF